MESHLLKKRQFKKRGKNQKSKKMNYTFEDTNKNNQFGPSNNNTPNNQQANQGKIFGHEMTEALKNYTIKSYAKCKGNKKFEMEMTNLLQKTIHESKMIGDLKTRNWNLFPLPQLSFEKLNTISLNNNFPLPQLHFNQFSPMAGMRIQPVPGMGGMNPFLMNPANIPMNMRPMPGAPMMTQQELFKQQMLKQSMFNIQKSMQRNQNMGQFQNQQMGQMNQGQMYGLNSNIPVNQMKKMDLRQHLQNAQKGKKNKKQKGKNKGKNNSLLNGMMSKQDQDLYRDLIRAQGKNKMLDSNSRAKFVDTNKYIDRIRGNLNLNDENADILLQNMLKIDGTSMDLEKKYFRLTEVPDPSDVRPLRVLKRSLAHILNKFETGQQNSLWVQDQFRSIRLVSVKKHLKQLFKARLSSFKLKLSNFVQDLGIQRIKNDFTVKVYEENAIFCLKVGETDQFNKCLMQVSELYDEGIKGRKHEFMMYRALYLTLNSEKNILIRYLKELDHKDLNTKPMKSVLKLMNNLVRGNFNYIFKQLEQGMEGTKLLIKMFLFKLRIWALQIIAKSFSKNIGFDKLADILKFENVSDLVEYLEEIGKFILNILFQPNSGIDCEVDKVKRVLVFKTNRAKINSNPKMMDRFD